MAIATVRSATKLSTVSPRAVRNHRPPAGPARHLDGGHRFAQRADLVELDQHGVGGLLPDAARDALDIGDEQVVADQLDLIAQFAVEKLPALPVVFGQAVLEHHDRVFPHPVSHSSTISAAVTLRPSVRRLYTPSS